MTAMTRKKTGETIRGALPQGTAFYCGEKEALEVFGGADVALVAASGFAGLSYSFAAARLGMPVALANKETLVCGGEYFMGEAQKHGAEIRPVDSEHSALWQALNFRRDTPFRRLLITASGGPFYSKTAEELQSVTAADALKHPTWNMGAKISIDSSTLMNKGLEVIEAHHLFAMPYDRISVVVQPQSAIHSMVEFSDGSVKAHLGTTDMRIPIQFALSYPERWDAPVEPLDFTKLGSLEFAAPDTDTFRCLALARAAGERGGTLPCVMNAANEVAVAAFLARKCAWLDIVRAIRYALEHAAFVPSPTLADYAEANAEARALAAEFLQLKN